MSLKRSDRCITKRAHNYSEKGMQQWTNEKRKRFVIIYWKNIMAAQLNAYYVPPKATLIGSL